MLKIRLDSLSHFKRKNSRSINDALNELSEYMGISEDIQVVYDFTHKGILIENFSFPYPDKIEFHEDDEYGYGPYLLVSKGGIFLRISTIDEKEASKQVVRKLEFKLRDQKRQIMNMQLVLENKNKALDAMGYVWCSGGCEGGIYRYTEKKLTEDIVKEAEKNTKRLRSWYETHKYRERSKKINFWKKLWKKFIR